MIMINDHHTSLSQNQPNGAALPRIDTDETDICCSSESQSKPHTLIFGLRNVAAQPKYIKFEISRTSINWRLNSLELRAAGMRLSKPNRTSRINTFCHFDKYIQLFVQIHFLFWQIHFCAKSGESRQPNVQTQPCKQNFTESSAAFVSN